MVSLSDSEKEARCLYWDTTTTCVCVASYRWFDLLSNGFASYRVGLVATCVIQWRGQSGIKQKYLPGHPLFKYDTILFYSCVAQYDVAKHLLFNWEPEIYYYLWGRCCLALSPVCKHRTQWQCEISQWKSLIQRRVADRPHDFSKINMEYNIQKSEAM